MGRVADILRAKGTAIYTISGTQTVYEAIEAMVRHNVGALVVIDDGDPVGIVSERDYLREVALKGRTSRATQVREIMSENVIVVDPDRSIEECMAIMTEKRVRHLPVVAGGDLVGLVSIGDVVKRLSTDQRFEIQYLTDYITGKYPA